MNTERLAQHLQRFYKDKKPDEIRETVITMQESGSNKGEIYRQMTANKGVGKSHASAMYPKNEGKLKNS